MDSSILALNTLSEIRQSPEVSQGLLSLWKVNSKTFLPRMGLTSQNPEESNLSPEQAPYLFIEYSQSTGLALQWWMFQQGWEPTGMILSMVFTPDHLEVKLAQWSEKLKWQKQKIRKVILPKDGVLWFYFELNSRSIFFGTGRTASTQSQLGKIRMPMEWGSDSSTPFLTSVMVNPPAEGGLSDPSLDGVISEVAAGHNSNWYKSTDEKPLQGYWWIIPSLFLIVIIYSIWIRRK